MSSSIYGKLALTNLKKNRKNYVPYILTCIITIAMFYIMGALSYNPGILELMGGNFVQLMMRYGMSVIGIFAVIFLFYTNSFLIRQRKREIGLYNVLGLGKRHITKMLICEMLVVVVVSLVAGLLSGMLLSKFMFLILLKFLHFTFTLKFTVETEAVVITLILFGCIFLASLIFNLLQIQLANPIELLRGGNQGEKEPKTKIIMTIIGVLTLGGGYYIAQTTESPLDALFLFLVAVILVIIGTYALFTAGSIAFLKLLKKNKNFYYNTRHFISVSGMMYRMKQNAVGLANICILSTMVLVMVSTTVAMYVGMDDLLKTRYSHEVTVTGFDLSDEEKDFINTTVEETAKKHNLTMKFEQQYECTPLAMKRTGNQFVFSGEESYASAGAGSYGIAYLMTEEEYNQLQKENIQLQENELLLFAPKNEIKADEIVMNNSTYQVKKHLKDMSVDKESYMTIDLCYIVVSDQGMIDELESLTETGRGRSFFKSVDFKERTKEQIPALEEIKNTLENSEISLVAECRELERDSFYSLYGSFLFLGIFLGLLFMMAMVLIIYYKQISEGYDDKERFAIMQKVGLSRREVKQSIRSQVMTVFFLPLVVACIHIVAAFKVITKILALLNLTNVTLFMVTTVITVGVFAVFYIIVFAITAREYYRIVK